jgi:hypothetical protein
VFGDLTDPWIYVAGPLSGGLLVAALWRAASMESQTAKLFHDSRYRCSLASELSAMSV